MPGACPKKDTSMSGKHRGGDNIKKPPLQVTTAYMKNIAKSFLPELIAELTTCWHSQPHTRLAGFFKGIVEATQPRGSRSFIIRDKKSL